MAAKRVLEKIPGTFVSPHHHDPWEYVKERWGNRMTGNELVFACVRNPYDWFATAFIRWSPSMKIDTLAEFVRVFDRDPFIQNGRMFWQIVDGVQVWKYETLERDLNVLMEVNELPPVELDRTNVTGRKQKPWPDYWDAEAGKALQERFGDELVPYGYPSLKWSTP